MIAYEVVWNGAIERQFAEGIRTEAAADLAAAPPPVMPLDLVFPSETIGGRLERHIRQYGDGVVYTTELAAGLLGTSRETASVYLRRARDRGLLISLEPRPGPRGGVKGAVLARFVAAQKAEAAA